MTVRPRHGVALVLGLACLLFLALRPSGGPGDDAPPPRPPARVATAPSPPTAPAPRAPAPPAPPPPVAAAPASVTSQTTIAVLRVGQAGARVELVSWTTKPIPFELDPALPAGAATYVLEDARTGERLASGPCTLPRLCPCPGTADHRRGCLRLRHEAVVRLKLPRVSASERLTILGPDGPVATFALKDA